MVLNPRRHICLVLLMVLLAFVYSFSLSAISNDQDNFELAVDQARTRQEGAWRDRNDHASLGTERLAVVCHFNRGPGLGNAIHGLVSCILFAMLTKRELYLDWPAYEGFTFSPNDPEGALSMPPWHELLTLRPRGSVLPWRAWDAGDSWIASRPASSTLTLTMEDPQALARLATENVHAWAKAHPIVELRGLHQSFTPIFILNPHTCKTMRGWFPNGGAFRALWAAFLLPSELVSTLVTSELRRLDFNGRHGGTLGVHLRTTALNINHADTTWEAQQLRLNCSASVASASTLRAKGRPRIFLVADSEVAKTRSATYLKSLGLDVITSVPLTHDALAAQSAGSGQSFGNRYWALVDILLLSGCDGLVAHDRSTFSSTAAGIGGIRSYMTDCKMQPAEGPCAHSMAKVLRLVSSHKVLRKRFEAIGSGRAKLPRAQIEELRAQVICNQCTGKGALSGNCDK